ncbi:MAG TPA: aldehyde dehydrogenase family protein [Patescibacteria group bacterium]|nr:aldehyde dehydrogenase family protein [Patescibacteria group bacterium]
MTYYPLYINGESVHLAGRQAVINPSDGKAFAEVAVADPEAAAAAIAAARAAFDSGPWAKSSLQERKEVLLKISQGIRAQAGELARLETLNTGKPIKESTFMDIPSAAGAFEYFAEHLQEYLGGERIDVSEEAAAMLAFEPRGVVVLIVPWNYPLLIASWKLACALSAGNTVVVKPSSLTPLTALALARIIDESGLPKGVVNVINGSGETLGKLLCADSRVDMVSFTGSNEVGRQILGYTASHVKKLIMELGGKSASLVLKDADLGTAVNGSLCSIFLNQGQMCTAMSRILVEDDIYERFIGDFVKKAKQIKLGHGTDYQTQMGPLISEQQRTKVAVSVERAVKEGARLACGGKIPDDPSLREGFFFEPTVLVDVLPGMSIFQQEVFGPVVCVSAFSDIPEAIALANNTVFGLAGCVWTKNAKLAQEIAAQTDAGTVWVNTYGMFYNQLPYGGFKQSGFGKELGREGLREYARLKNVVFDRSKDGRPLVNYWYGF